MPVDVNIYCFFIIKYFSMNMTVGLFLFGFAYFSRDFRHGVKLKEEKEGSLYDKISYALSWVMFFPLLMLVNLVLIVNDLLEKERWEGKK